MTEALWTVPPDHPAFAGHFPGRPILPGVVVLDRALALAAAQFALDPAALRLTSAKFLSPVAPGETLAFSLQAAASGSVQFAVRCGDRPVASGTLTLRAEAA
ncbi:3-hydroxyacyl-ACP dehydratase FabZ family protein [Azospira restricta]|uniref:ApeI dehydratase-like domain-containing protein n=1 Tax=Azospira restricta TaxID=404405 RepID=A0A974SQW7_9RHOO|nr:MaoC/PaaZ C-terminal domain-containing protein [Azospira restricta]QRJ64754.1 hypothetical protein IWH25_05235 [Azospira restricta]